MKLIHSFFILFCLAGPGLSRLSGQGHEVRMQALDVLDYRFTIFLSDSADVIHGTAEIRLLFTQELDSFFLDLAVKDPSGTGMVIDQLLEEGAPARFVHRQDRVHIAVARTTPGNIRTYRIQYHGIPGDGLIISKNRFGDRTFFADNWPDRAHCWLPVVDHPSDKARVEFLVHCPERCRVVSVGRNISQYREGGSLVSRWATDVPLPTKVMVIGVAPFAVQQLDTIGGIPVSTWVFPQNSEKGFMDYSIASRPLAFFQSLLGPFPFSKLANVQSKTRFGGMENASCIFYNENTVNGDRDLETLFAHEIAHQWFGDAVSELDWHHIWISEGITTYLTDLYLEKVHGKEAFLASLLEEKMNVFRYAAQKPAPIIDTSLTVSPALLNSNSYDKAAWVLHMLRREIGEDSFLESLRLFYEAHKYGNALTADFQQVAETVSGRDLEHFFEQWFYREGYPLLSFRFRVRRNRIGLIIRQRQDQGPFAFPLDVAIEGTNGTVRNETVMVKGSRERFILATPFGTSRVELDPDSWLLFDRL